MCPQPQYGLSTAVHLRSLPSAHHWTCICTPSELLKHHLMPTTTYYTHPHTRPTLPTLTLERTTPTVSRCHLSSPHLIHDIPSYLCFIYLQDETYITQHASPLLLSPTCKDRTTPPCIMRMSPVSSRCVHAYAHRPSSTEQQKPGCCQFHRDPYIVVSFLHRARRMSDGQSYNTSWRPDQSN